MIARRLGVLALLATVAVAIAGCGASKPKTTPVASDIPLLPGAHITVQSRTCDQGSHAFCAVDLVVVDHAYQSSDDLAKDEGDLLRQHGWSQANGDTSQQFGANSPGHDLRLTYSTATGDLQSIDLGYIGRPWPITYALSNSIFDGTAAMSMMLEVGAT